MAIRVAAAAAIGESDIEESVVGVAGLGERIERGVAGIVIGVGLLPANQFARPGAIVSRSVRIVCGPFKQQGMVCAGSHVRLEVSGHGLIRGIHDGVELAEAPRATLIELGMERKGLKAPFIALIRSHGLAVGADAIQLPIHVAGEVPLRSRFVQHRHDARRLAVEVGNRRKFGKLHRDHAIGRRDGLRKWIGALLSKRDTQRQQQNCTDTQGFPVHRAPYFVVRLFNHHHSIKAQISSD